jgi:hypothetical protein
VPEITSDNFHKLGTGPWEGSRLKTLLRGPKNIAPRIVICCCHALWCVSAGRIIR